MSEYRPNAGIVVFNRQKKVLLCRRIGWPDAWQFPQGGIDEGETPAMAAERELREETSLCGLKRVKTLDYGTCYDFPPEIAKNLSYDKKRYVGQRMYWSLFYFSGNDGEIKLETAEPEFDAFCWSTLEKACELIVEFKKSAYLTALNEFSDIIKNYVAED